MFVVFLSLVFSLGMFSILLRSTSLRIASYFACFYQLASLCVPWLPMITQEWFQPCLTYISWERYILTTDEGAMFVCLRRFLSLQLKVDIRIQEQISRAWCWDLVQKQVDLELNVLLPLIGQPDDYWQFEKSSGLILHADP